MSTEIFTAWQARELSNEAALRGLIRDLQEEEAEQAAVSARIAVLRERISHVVAAMGNKAVVPGYGTLVIRAPGRVQRWDHGALEELAQSLRETGQGDIADEILGCKKAGVQPGGLAISPERRKEPAA
jgi:hypothetical protein